MASLLVHVMNVIQLGSQEKVIWSDTEPIVTAMQDLETFRNGSEVQNPRGSVGVDFRAPRPGVNAAISFRHFTTSPIPAVIRLLDLRPKPSGETFRKTLRQVGVLLKPFSRSNHTVLPRLGYWPSGVICF